MKKIYYSLAAMLFISLICFENGYGQTQTNPFSVKQKSTIDKNKSVAPTQALFDKGTRGSKPSDRYASNYKYHTLPFIMQNTIAKENFASLRHDKNGLLIHAESKPGYEKTVDTRSDEGLLEASYQYLDDVKKAMRINDPNSEFTELDTWVDELGMTHVKMQQQLQGVRVYGGQLILHGQQGMINKFNGTYFPTPKLSSVSPNVSETNAENEVLQDLQVSTTYTSFSEAEENLLKYDGPVTELVIYHHDRNFSGERLAWYIVARPNLLERWEYFVDAETGEIIHKFNSTCSDGPTTAQAVDLKGVTQTINTYLIGSTYYLIDASRPMYNSGQSTLPDNPVGAIWTVDANNQPGSSAQITHVTSSNNTWNDASSVSAHNSAGITYEYFKNTHSRNSIDGQGGTIISIVNVADDDGSGLDNAYWNGQFMFYGNGDQVFLPLARGLDVGAHEMAHGVTQHTANLEYQNESGAINEAMSDIAGAMVDRQDWQLGEDVVPSNSPYFPSGAMRDMQDPHNGGASFSDPAYQPKHTSEMYNGTEDNGGVHMNSGIINHAYYQIATATNKEKAEKMYYRALANYMTKSSQFIDCRLAFEQAAKDLYGNGSTEYNAVVTAFFNVGIGENSGGGEGTPPPGDLPPNPGADYILFVDDIPTDPTSIYLTNPDISTFWNVSETKVKRRVSITDDGSYGVFVAENNAMRIIDFTADPFAEQDLSNEYIWDNVAISKDGNRIAAITTEVDSTIWIYDFTINQWAGFKLYNPTFTEDQVTYNVLYADALEWDYSGEFLIYDAYNQLKNGQGEDIDYWDMGFLRAWNNSSGNWNDGQIFKIFASLPEGVSVGNPSLSKNTPYIMAFDYLDDYNGEVAVLGGNLETGDLAVIYENSVLGFPNYSMDDKKLVFTGVDSGDNENIKIISMNNDKITPSGNASQLIDFAKWPVWFATGERDLSDIDEVENNAFYANSYPNPFADELNVVLEITDKSDFTIEIYNIFGQKIKHLEGSGNKELAKATIQTGDLERGTYFVRIAVDKSVVTRKVVKLD